MKPNEEQKLLMTYLNEANPEDTDECLNDPELCRQLDQLESDMKAIENAQNQHQLADDYGQQLWLKINDQLEERPQEKSWLVQIKQWFLVPQYSMASFVAVLGLVVLAFYAGHSQNQAAINTALQEQLLAQNIQLHLTQSEIFLTQVRHDTGNTNHQATAQRLLASNRIFKRALVKHEGQFTTELLSDLEPILLEYANDNQLMADSNGNKQVHGKQPQANWVSDRKSADLMFQIKVMKQQLAQKNDII